MDIKSSLIDSGALYTSLSGGSTMFGIYNDIDLANNAISYLNRYHTCLALPKFNGYIGGSFNGRTHGFGPWDQGSTLSHMKIFLEIQINL